MTNEMKTCPNCQGRRFVLLNIRCPHCHGTGVVPVENSTNGSEGAEGNVADGASGSTEKA